MRAFVSALGGLVVLPAAALGQFQYVAIDLGTLPGQVGAAAYDINERGWVTGNSHSGFLWKPETGMQPLLPHAPGNIAIGHALNFAGVVAGESDPPSAGSAVRWVNSPTPQALPGQTGSFYSRAYGINDAGDIVGVLSSRATLWRADGSVVDLGLLPGSTLSIAYDINNSGVIVGQSGNAQTSRAFRWTAATGMVALPLPPNPPANPGAAARAVNENGDIVGWGFQFITYPNTQPITVYRAAYWPAASGWQFVDLGEPLFPAVSSWANDINDQRRIVGYNVDQITERPFIWTEATGMVSLRDVVAPGSGIRIRKPYAINNAGQIVGEGVLNETRINAFLLNPVGGACYANCDASTAAPVLNVADFTCFLQRFAAGESYANCDQSTSAPALNVADFTCFLQSFAAGCP